MADYISIDALSTHTLNVGGDDRTVDLTEVTGLVERYRIDAINLDHAEGTGSNAVTLNSDDVLQAGVDRYIEYRMG